MILNAEEKQTLEDLMAEPVYWNVILKAIRAGVDRQKEQVLTCSIEETDRKIAFSKARLEGAEALEMFVMNLKRRKKDKNV
jgi:hypothetical protein